MSITEKDFKDKYGSDAFAKFAKSMYENDRVMWQPGTNLLICQNDEACIRLAKECGVLDMLNDTSGLTYYEDVGRKVGDTLVSVKRTMAGPDGELRKDAIVFLKYVGYPDEIDNGYSYWRVVDYKNNPKDIKTVAKFLAENSRFNFDTAQWRDLDDE